MTCKFLIKREDVMPPEIGGPLTQEVILVDDCKLKRDPRQVGWITNCQNTLANGPCWYWVEEHGASTADHEFEQG